MPRVSPLLISAEEFGNPFSHPCCESLLAAVTEYHRQVAYTQQNLFLMVLEAGMSNIKVSTDLVSGEGPHNGS